MDICRKCHHMYAGDAPARQVYPVAAELLRMFQTLWAALLERIKDDPEGLRVAGDRCALCGYSTLTWEPQVYYCNGASCGAARIRRNNFFWVGAGNQHHWCTQCYAELRDGEPIRVGDQVHILVSRLQLKLKVKLELNIASCDAARIRRNNCFLGRHRETAPLVHAVLRGAA